MKEVLIIADDSIGKVIGKYLQRDSVNVRWARSLEGADVAGRRFPVVIAEIADDQPDIACYIRTVHDGTGCRTLILLIPMEQSSLTSDPMMHLPGVNIIVISKPIRLAMLAPLIQKELTDEQQRVEPDVAVNSVG